jgi:hypothetical protein
MSTSKNKSVQINVSESQHGLVTGETMKDKTLDNVYKALERVDPKLKQDVFNLSLGLSEEEIIQQFNQQAFDLFANMIKVAKRRNFGDAYVSKFGGYKNLYENAIKMNRALPADRFTLLIMEYAPEIYSDNEQALLEMPMPDVKCKVENEFEIIRSDEFKKLWNIIDSNDKKEISGTIKLLTYYAHALLYSTANKVMNTRINQ